MNDDELSDRLAGWSDDPAPAVDGAFANRLETDLRMQAMQPEPRHRGIRNLLIRPAVVVVGAVAILAGIFWFGNDGDADTVFLASADGTSVSIPGSPTTTEGVAGFDLPEGSQIVVGPGGQAIVAGVVLEAGTTARIVDGEVELIDVPIDDSVIAAPSTTETPPVDGPTTTTQDVTTSEQVASTTTATTVAPSSSDTDRQTTTTAPATTRPTTTTTPPTTTTARPTTTDRPTQTTPPSDQRVKIELGIGDRRGAQAVLRWTADGALDAVAGWEVRVRRGDEVGRVALIREPAARRLRVEIPGRNAEYMVLARNQAGEVIGRSGWVPAAP